jgi:hypothetical protein
LALEMTLQIAMATPERLPGAFCRAVGVEPVRKRGKRFAEGGEDWDERDLSLF